MPEMKSLGWPMSIQKPEGERGERKGESERGGGWGGVRRVRESEREMERVGG